ncbi:MAG: hypothetical protein GXO63_02200 [Candidatus Micrarchaeota archaeon]|nr:hypothetical protein [Candidatus Micrarchaeota archaeon]
MRKSSRKRVSFGTLAFVGIFIISYLMVVFEVYDVSAVLIIGILGAAVGIFNITAKEERGFLLAITTLNIIILAWNELLILPLVLERFLSYLVVGFGAAGLIIALAVIIRLGFER